MGKFLKTRNVIILLVLVMLFGAVVYALTSNKGPEGLKVWNDTRIRCLPSGHQELGVHVHPQVGLFLDGKIEIIPANIGITSDCMAEIHTHDMTGIVHVESADLARADDFMLSDFFDVWGKSLEREGYDLSVFLNGERSEDPASISLRDKDSIEIKYTKK